MSRNRRNIRRIRTIKDVLNIKTFIIIVSILCAIIIICIGINQYKRYQDKSIIAKQDEELEEQRAEMFSNLNNKIAQTNKNI